MIIRLILTGFSLLLWFGVIVAGYDIALGLYTYRWVPVEAEVLELKTEYVSTRRPPHVFKVNMRYQYSFEGKIYESTQFSLREGRTYTGEWMIRQWGNLDPKTITAYVNPKKPDQAVIDKGNSLKVTILIIVGAILAVIVSMLAYGSFKGGFKWKKGLPGAN